MTAFVMWKVCPRIHDDNPLFSLDDDSTDLHYVNLLKNPERYTGYKGKSAQKVWQCIYQENCFKPDPRFDKNFLANPSGNNGMCLEKRVFYRLISGLHSAITVSIAAYNYKPGKQYILEDRIRFLAVEAFGTGTWFRNVEMFTGRFGTQWSWEGPERLMNIYFVYFLELRALVKVAPYLKQELFYTGNDEEDEETRQAIQQLIEICKSFDNHYDETTMFTVCLLFKMYIQSLRESTLRHGCYAKNSVNTS